MRLKTGTLFLAAALSLTVALAFAQSSSQLLLQYAMWSRNTMARRLSIRTGTWRRWMTPKSLRGSKRRLHSRRGLSELYRAEKLYSIAFRNWMLPPRLLSRECYGCQATSSL
jgi:hypothetical protein